MNPLSFLRADLYNAPAIPTSRLLPDSSVGFWQPTVVTLISGQSEAVLVDTLFTSEQAVSLGDWIKETLNGKILTTIYITHGHGDHWFNLSYLTKRFPGVKVVSTQESIDHMSSQLTPEYRTLWNDLFPGQIDEESFRVLAKPLKDNKFTLEGHTLEAVNVGHSDTDATTFLYVPSLNMSSDRDDWVDSLDKLESYNPSIVIGSHHRPGGVDGAFNIGASREYIRTFSKFAKESKSAEQLYDKMLHAYPSRIGKLVLWLGCQAQFP
ncbi:hypothetical protein FAVG1_02238 [Fusarium avenaceum]|nr:hypothetical protein FAVG1_02238 [Fusarium avenaceum]